jgi:uncharacterized protein (UPF0264 family)
MYRFQHSSLFKQREDCRMKRASIPPERKKLMNAADMLRAPRTRLLVSVRNLAEALLARAADVDLIDVKEPRLGSLAAALPVDLQEIASELPQGTPLSAALGELYGEHLRPAQLPPAFRFGKIGLAHAASSDWQHCLLQYHRQFHTATKPVAVIYADYSACRAPAPESILQFAAEQNMKAVLIDTYFKDGQTVLDVLSQQRLSELLQKAREAQMTSVLAGSLSKAELTTALQLHPDYVAVRGAVCEHDRQSEISARKIREFRHLLCSHEDIAFR